MTEHKIEDRHDTTYKEPDKPEFDGDNIQLNIEQQSYGEQLITDDSDNVINKPKAREILEETESMMRESFNEPDQSTNSRNDVLRRVKRQQTQSPRGMATKTRSYLK